MFIVKVTGWQLLCFKTWLSQFSYLERKDTDVNEHEHDRAVQFYGVIYLFIVKWNNGIVVDEIYLKKTCSCHVLAEILTVILFRNIDKPSYINM